MMSQFLFFVHVDWAPLRTGFVVLSGPSQGIFYCVREALLIELTGDDNSSTLAVTVQIRLSPEEYAWSSHIAEYG